jgi:methanogenic corrinoid protein MtbC1
VLSRSLTLGPALAIFDRALGPALRRIGDLWHDGTVTVAQEHLASQIMMGALIDLLRLSQPAEASRRAALACFADEDHILGLYGMALRFASWGFRTVMIGARTPPAAIARIVSTLNPSVVALSVTIPPAPPRARELIDAYADACQSTPWVVGGHGAGALSSWIEPRGGLVSAGDGTDVRKTLDRLLLQKKRRGNGSGEAEQ